MELSKVHKIGCVDDPEARVVRVVHISDTHMRHNDFLPTIPPGDILIHSGDFSSFSPGRYFGNKTRDATQVIEELNSFFGKAPFKHKIFVSGNHELSFTAKTKEHVERNLHNVIYLQDSSVTIEGIKIHGSPWNSKRWTSYARGFTKSWGHFEHYWDLIPADTNIVVTHMPPLGIMDLAMQKFKFWKGLLSASEGLCDICGEQHLGYEHWGCRELKKTVLQRVKPSLHLYGHVHESTGVRTIDSVTFSNAAMKLAETANVFDYYLKNTSE